MKNTYLENSLKKWLKENEQRFPYQPHIKRWNEETLEIVFSEVSCISIITGTSDIGISAFHEDECIDLLTTFELKESRNKLGYSCKFCNDGKYYESRFSLYADHLFEPLLEWVKESIRPSHSICFYKTHNKGSQWAKILPDSKVETDKDFEYMFHKEKVIRAQK